ncbi:MAG: hypothetical protein ACTS4T_01720, partial [Candidatus Hodgkinia cicadicola]
MHFRFTSERTSGFVRVIDDTSFIWTSPTGGIHLNRPLDLTSAGWGFIFTVGEVPSVALQYN